MTVSVGGVYTCTVGGVSVNTTVTVTNGEWSICKPYMHVCCWSSTIAFTITWNLNLPPTDLFPPDTATISTFSPVLASPPEHAFIVGGASGIFCVSTPAVDLILLMNLNILREMAASTQFIGSINSAGFYQCASSSGDLAESNLYTNEEEGVYALPTCE